MRKDFVISKVESSQDGSPYVYVTFHDPNDPKTTSKADRQSPFGGSSGEAIPFTSPEDLMKNLPEAVSNIFGGAGGMSGNSPTFKISMREYEDTQLKVGDKITIEIKKADSSGI